ncbi:hypothetical protein [Sinomonas sp. ASV322]|uniref:hypothetical protein n=1 Tax=Sinomonas sp. ASV322 TaxID=3041920 RepID=UPI0027DC8A07|nr:hypothetical protein [Sinomonas sp. ASV322]MDQ4504513.1 hypothetical protein [Sinomonas sp. ASV322]
MIKRLWQFPAVIGGTAVLTFCGVSALQASINGPLHSYGVAVEAARSSASASAAIVALAAATPSVRPNDDGAAAPQGLQAAMATQTSAACTGAGCVPAVDGRPQPAPSPAEADGARPQGANRGDAAAAAAAGSGQQGDDDQSGAGQGTPPGQQQAGNSGRGAAAYAPGHSAAGARGGGQGGSQGGGQQGSGVLGGVGTLANSAVGATTDATSTLAREVSQWLGLPKSLVTAPSGIAAKAHGNGNGH